MSIISVTPAQATAAGYSVLFGAGHRVQAWSGTDAQGNTKNYIFDTIGNKAVKVDDVTPEKVALYAIAVTVTDLVNLQSIGAGAKATAIAVMTDALGDL